MKLCANSNILMLYIHYKLILNLWNQKLLIYFFIVVWHMLLLFILCVDFTTVNILFQSSILISYIHFYFTFATSDVIIVYK